MKEPNFFIVGAPKAGTTSLYEYLGQHPRIYMSPLKEPNFFADELRVENFVAEARPRAAREARALQEYLRGDMRERRFGGLVSSWEDYLRLFRGVNDEIASGEASACYLWSPSAARNIAARVPSARIIVNLRNPVDRAFSQYLQMLSVGATRRSFRAQVEANLRNRRFEWGADWPLLEFGHYHEQLERYLRAFPRSQIHISLYEDLQSAPRELLMALYAFLGVEPRFDVDLSRRYHQPSVPKLTGPAYWLKKTGVWPRLRKLVPRSLDPLARSLVLRSRASLRPTAEDRSFLIDYYREDIAKLGGLLGRDLSAWLDPHERPDERRKLSEAASSSL